MIRVLARSGAHCRVSVAASLTAKTDRLPDVSGATSTAIMPPIGRIECHSVFISAYSHVMSHANNAVKLRTGYVAPNLRALNMSQMKYLV